MIEFATAGVVNMTYGGKFECWEFFLQTDFLPKVVF